MADLTFRLVVKDDGTAVVEEFADTVDDAGQKTEKAGKQMGKGFDTATEKAKKSRKAKAVEGQPPKKAKKAKAVVDQPPKKSGKAKAALDQPPKKSRKAKAVVDQPPKDRNNNGENDVEAQSFEFVTKSKPNEQHRCVEKCNRQ